MLEDTKIYMINDRSMLERLFSYADRVKSDLFVYDVETDSVIPRQASLYGIGICFDTNRAFYIPWRNQDGSEVWQDSDKADIIAWIKDMATKKKLIGHNIIYDVLVSKYQLGIDLTHNVYSDTILLKHTLDEEPPFGLKECAVRDLGPWADKAQQKLKDSVLEHGGKWKKDQKDMYLADTDILGEYCCWDVLLTLLLFRKYDKKLHKEGLEKLFYEDEIMDLYRWCTIPMKDKGFPIDVEYYENLREELDEVIIGLEDEIINNIMMEDALYAKQGVSGVSDFIETILDKEVKLSKGGKLPVLLSEELGIPLPKNVKTGKVTLSAAAIKKQKENSPQYAEFYDWLLDKDSFNIPEPQSEIAQALYFDRNDINKARTKAYLEKKGGRYIFNISSNDHLAEYFINIKNYKPLEFSEKTKKPKVDAKFLETISEEDPVAAKILDYKRLCKIQSTYVIGILDRQIDGFIYTDMLQFGTTSGRYSSCNPNLQNQPRIKDEESGLSELVLKYVNAIRGGFAAPGGYKIVNADFSQLEPCCFSHMSGDEKLRDVFRNGEDLYARVAIDVFNLTQYSASKKDPNYLKKMSPEFRSKAKVFTLAVPYGAEEARVGQAMKVDWNEAHRTINSYLNAYPNLKKYMWKCNKDAVNKGYVKTEFGRVRHLQEAMKLAGRYGEKKLTDYKWAKSKGLLKERRIIKNLLNNAKNFRIQGLAAHIVNRAMIALAKRIHELGLDAWVGLQVHDEITCIAEENIAPIVAKHLQDCMENTTKISVPLVAEPLIADRWSEAK